MKPLVSAIIPTRNRARLLHDALVSVIRQQGAGEAFQLEVVVVDDASSDNTPAVVGAHPDVRYVRLASNRGLAAARNAGIRVSRGRYLAFLDDDDLWLPWKLARQVPALEHAAHAGVLYSQCILRTGGREFVVPEGRPPGSEGVLEHLLERNLAPVHCFLARRDLVEAVGNFDEDLRCFEDHDLWIRLALRTPFMFLPGPVAVYCRSSAGMALTQQASGGAARANGQILEKTVRSLRGTTATLRAQRAATACLEFHRACAQVFDRRPQAALPALRSVTETFFSEPEAGYRPLGLPRIAGLFAVAADDPIALVESLCETFRRAAGAVSPPHRRQLNRLLGDVWTDVAYGLASAPGRRDGEAVAAGLRALRLNPSSLPRLKFLLWLIVRGVSGRRSDALVSTLHRGMRRLA